MGGKNSGKGTKPIDISKRFQTDFLETMDGRVTAVKALHGRFNALATDLGGIDGLSFQEKTLCKRVVHLEALITKMESVLVKGGAVEVHVYLAAINALASLLSRLGLKRRSKQISLRDYLNTKPEPQAAPLQPTQGGTQSWE